MSILYDKWEEISKLYLIDRHTNIKNKYFDNNRIKKFLN